FLELLGGVESDGQPLDDGLLADDLAQPARPQRRVALAVGVGGLCIALDYRLPWHRLVLAAVATITRSDVGTTGLGVVAISYHPAPLAPTRFAAILDSRRRIVQARKG